MDLRQLAVLTAVADHRSFSAAARALHTVQSNVSTHVARLERELGTSLVDRTSGVLTDAGELVVARARRVQAELEALTSDVASSVGDIAGQVRFGVIGTIGRWLIPLLLAEMHGKHPKVQVVVASTTTTSLVPQLAARQLDLAVVNLPVTHPDVESMPVFEEAHRLVVPDSHPLAGRKRITLTELAGQPVLLEPKGTGFRDDLDADATRVGVELVPAAEVDGMRLLASLAFQGYGAAVLPASAVQREEDPHWKAIPLDGCTPRAVGVAVPRRGRLSAAARATQTVLQHVLATDGPSREGIRLIGG